MQAPKICTQLSKNFISLAMQRGKENVSLKRVSKVDAQAKRKEQEIFDDFIFEMRKVWKFGGTKHGFGGYLKRTANEYFDAAQRHIKTHQDGHEFDHETHYASLAHAAVRLMFARAIERESAGGK
jgi:hypothetical protein